MTAPPPFSIETPALRALEIMPAMHQGRQLLVVRDPLGIMEGVAVLAPDPLVLIILQTANGERSVEDIARIAREQTGFIVTADKVRNVVRELDAAGMLYSETFVKRWEARREEFRNQPTRKSAIFQGDDRLLMLKELGDEFRRHRMSRQSPPERLDLPNGSVRAVLSPHIDFRRGGEAYSWAYKAIADHTKADTFIILGTLHKPSSHPFIATAKSFETPLGTVEVNKEILAELEQEFGGELYSDEYQHAEEHTIELQVVYLQHMLQGRPFRIVPVLVGSFEEYLYVDPPVQPNEDEEVAAFINALRTIMRRHGDRVVLIGGVDFSHCGQEFGDEELVTEEREQEIRAQDAEMLGAIERVDPRAFFESFRSGMNDRRVCSIAAIYCVLSAMEELHEGRTLLYNQANNSERTCMVSFASVAFVPKEAEKPRIILASH